MTKEMAKEIVESFEGEYFNEYENHYNYVINGGWEQDYFSSWLEGCSNYPYLSEIIAFCKETDEVIRLYIEAVEED